VAFTQASPYIAHFTGTCGAREALPWANWPIGNADATYLSFLLNFTTILDLCHGFLCLYLFMIQYYKQTQLEAMASEKAAAEFQLEKEVKRLQEAQVCHCVLTACWLIAIIHS